MSLQPQTHPGADASRSSSRWAATAFTVLLAACLNWGFFVGDLSDPVQHHGALLWAAAVAGLGSTALTLSTRTEAKPIEVAVRLVADVQLIVALLVFQLARSTSGRLSPQATTTAVSLSGGALLANIVAVTLLVTLAVRVDLRGADTSVGTG